MRFAFKVDVRLAADVDCHLGDGAAGERPRLLAGIVVGDAGTAVAATDAKALAPDHELARLGLDPALADLVFAVVEGQDARWRRRAGPRRPSRRRRTGSGPRPWERPR